MQKTLGVRTEQKVREFNENKRKKMEIIRQENKKKEMEECTFRPATYSRPYEHRNLDQFLSDQNRFLEEKMIKQNQILADQAQDVDGKHRRRVQQ